jgi:hypothetical protein
MAGHSKLRQIQLGREASAGEPVSCSRVWRGPANSIEALDEIEFVEEDVANFGGTLRTCKLSKGAQLAIPETRFNFLQFLHLCEMGIKAVSPSQDGTGSGYVSTYPFPLTSTNTIKTYTVEAGNDQDVDEMDYSFCPEFTVSGNPSEGVTMSALLRGRERTDASFTAAPTTPSVNCAVFNKSELYIDAVGGSMGSTQVTGTFLGFTINVNTGLMPVFTGDGQLYFYDVDQGGWEITGDIAFRHNATADTEDGNWLSQTARLIEIKLLGPALTTSDTYSYYQARFQFPVKYSNFSTLEDRDGKDVLIGSFRAGRDTTFGDGPKIVVVQEESDVPGTP